MFYADVPTHEWRIFGSVAAGTDDLKSDIDAMLCGVTREQLDHPYFVDTLQTLKAFSVEEGHSLDLFLDLPSEHRLESIYSPKKRAIDAGPKAYELIKALSKTCFIVRLFALAAEAAQQDRQGITSYQEFKERQLKKAHQHAQLT